MSLNVIIVLGFRQRRCGHECHRVARSKFLSLKRMFEKILTYILIDRAHVNPICRGIFILIDSQVFLDIY